MLDRLEEEDYGEYWSVSKLQVMQQCGRKFKYQYIDKLPTVKDATLKFGTAVHHCLEVMHKESIWTEGGIQRLWADVWTPYVASIDWSQETLTNRAYKNRGQEMLLVYGADKYKDDEILELEKRFRIKPSLEGVTLTAWPTLGGMIDKVFVRGGRACVVDYKTSKYPPDPFILASDPQLTMYYLACKELGYDVKDFAIHNLKDGTEYWTTRDDKDVEILLESIGESQAKVKNKMYSRNISFMCKSCPFKEQCLGRDLGKVIEELPPDGGF